MVAKDRFPLLLSQEADEPEWPDIEKARDRAVSSSRILKTSILGVTAAAIVFAVLWIGNPVALFPSATAFLVATPAPQDGLDKSTSVIQSAIQTAAAPQALSPTSSEAPTGETASAVETPDQKQAETPQPSTEPLLNQFQAWAAEQDARQQVAAVEPTQEIQPVQDAAPAQDAGPQFEPEQKHRHIQRVQNARKEIRAEQNLRPKVRRKQAAQVRPAQDARAQERPAQNAAPSLLRRIGLGD
jgi:outer membrane biosynthesis protein TonB